MIRREVRFDDGPPQWLLISQVEHARLSGELVARCLDQFGAPGESLDGVRQELLAAVVHHDDGWAEWEKSPRLHPEHGYPLSFMELPTDEAIVVWRGSIESAHRFGDLAGWVVAGHFSALLATIGKNTEVPVARQWLKQTAARRSEWFARWHAQNESLHTAEIAAEALKWLQLFDILSLWPCAQYPVADEKVKELPEPFLNVDNWMLVREIKPQFHASGGGPCRIEFKPWPFKEREIEIQVSAHLVPAKVYRDAAELLAARTPFVARWILVAGE